MPNYEDPLDAAMRRQLPSGWQQAITPEQARDSGLQWTGGNSGWQPYVSPEQATAQNLQYTGGPTPVNLPGQQQYGLMTPQGGGSVMVATPENVSRFGMGVASGPAANLLAEQNAANDQSTAFSSALAPIQSRRAQLAASLPSMSRRQAAGAVAQIHDLNAQEQALHFEANQRRMLAHQNSVESHRQLSTDRETSIDEQGHAMLQGMGQLDAALRNGRIDKNAYDDSLLQLGQQYPLAMRHPEAARHFEFAITEADKQNAYNLRRETTQAAKLGAKYGINAAIDEETGLPSVAATQRAALQTTKGRNEALKGMSGEMQLKYGIPAGIGVSALFNPISPHTDTGDGKGINLPFLDPKTGTVVPVPVSKEIFNRAKSDFNDRYFSLNPPSGAQTAGAAPTTPQAAPASPMVRLRAPNGMVREVPQDQAEHFTKLGATLEQ